MKHAKTSKHDKWNKKKKKLNTLTSNIHLNNTDHLAASHKKGTIKSTKSQLELCFKKA